MVTNKRYSLILLLFALVISPKGGMASLPDSLAVMPDSLAVIPDSRSQLRLDAIAQSKEIAIRAKKNGDYARLFLTQRELGRLYQQNGQYPLAEQAFRQALEVAVDHLESEEQRLSLYKDIAYNYQLEEKYKEARDFFQKMTSPSQLKENPHLAEEGYKGLGKLYYHIGDHAKALEYYDLVLNSLRSRSNQSGVVRILLLSCKTYLQMGDFDAASNQIKEAQQLCLHLDEPVLLAQVYFDFGNVLQKRQHNSRAIAKFVEALHLFEKYDQPASIAATLLRIGMSYSQHAKDELALQYLQRLASFEDHLNPEDKAKMYYCKGDLLTRQGDWEMATQSFHKSLEMSRVHNLKSQSQQAHHRLFELYNEKEYHDKALLHLERFVSLNDSMYDAHKTQQLTQLQFKYDIERSEKAIHALQLQQNQLILAGLCVSAAIVILGLMFFWRMRVRNSQALKKKNSAIKIQNSKLQKSNAFLKQFANVAAHDLKEPLRNIGSFINLLQNRYGGQFNEEAREYMGFVTNGAKRMNNLLVDLLEYSRISAEEAVREPLNIRDVVDEVCENLKGRIDRKEASIYCAPGMPEIPMSRLHLGQLLQNLISNALKFSEQKPIVRINAYKRDQQIILSIKDNGIGINKDFSHKVFNLFQVLDKRSKQEGTGIGLTICKNIVDKYDGQIWFDSRLGEGTTFFVSVPLGAAKKAARTAQEIIESN
ncbi:MAG: ATP-binding protein [Bacteroidota bacterium]